jgi:serine/threonine-protein kinase
MSESEKPAPPAVGETLVWESGAEKEATRDLTGKTLGDFQVERMLGRGGMGEVYLARQVSLNRPVALKVLRPDMLTRPTYLSRFEAEATAVARLNHPNIVHVYMLGQVEGVRFIAMEYVQGTNLRDYLQKKGALDLPLALSIMKQAGVAVGAAGEIGLIHRDIKPENLLLTRKGQVKIADFGLCRDQDAESIQLTQPGVTMGTPQYMSPEQAQGHALDHRSDLYSLGVTFYHMLTGTPPFRAETALAVALKHVKDVPVSPSVFRRDLPPDLERLVLKLMSKRPEDRYQSAAEMLRDLAKIRESMATTSMPLPEAVVGSGSNGAPVAVPTPASAPTAPPARPWSWPKVRLSEVQLRPRQLVPLAVFCLAAGLFCGWLGRTPNLLSASAAQPKGVMPGMWMVAEWREIPQQAAPEAQYHYAQLHVSKADQEAAWIAVPGYFPESREWASKAYVQLARALLRHQDLDRLRVLAAELARWNPDRLHEKELAAIVQAAVDTLDGKVEEVITALGPLVSKATDPSPVVDPALLELSLEVTSAAVRSSSRNGGMIVPEGLLNIQAKLLQRLYNVEFRGS